MAQSRGNLQRVALFNLFVVAFTLSPFLPGPGFASVIPNVCYSVAQLSSIFSLVLIPFGIVYLFLGANGNTNRNPKQDNFKGLLLSFTPVILFLTALYCAFPMRELSRRFAMDNAKEIVVALEEYKTDHKVYPAELKGLTPAYLKWVPHPWVMGIQGYRYKLQDDTYTLSFTQNVVFGFNFEVVMYEPHNRHQAQGEQTELYEAGRKNWKYYVYD